MTFNDIFKSSFLNYVTAVSITDMALTLTLSFCLGLFIFYVYKKTYAGVMYSSSFGVTLIAMTMITALVILAISSNVVLSLGMVGALSIVRFRTAIKDPMDLMFLFWSISIGIICGAGLAEIAVILSLVLTVGVLILDHIPVAKAPMILVVNAVNPDVEGEVMDVVGQFSKHPRVKSRNMTSDTLDITIELRTDRESELIKGVMNVPDVSSAALLSHDGEVTF